MANYYLKAQKFLVYSIVLLSGAMLLCSTSFAQSITGSTSGLDPCAQYDYTLNVTLPSTAKNVSYDWYASTGYNTITFSNSQSSIITWRNEPDSRAAKQVACRLRYTYTQVVNGVSTPNTPYDQTFRKNVTVKYLGPIGAFSINGVSQTGSSYRLNCGTGAITISVPPVATEPANSVAYTWSVPTGWSISSGSGTSSITVVPSLNSQGTVRVTAKRSDATCTTSKSISITRPLPTTPVISRTNVPANGLLCNGSISLTATAQNVTSYVWEATGVLRVNGGLTATTTGGVNVTVAGSGIGTVKVRAYSQACQIYSPYSSVVTLKYDVPPVYQTNSQGAKVIAVGESGTLVSEYSGYPVSSSSSGLKLKIYATDANSMSWRLTNGNGCNAALAYPSTTTFDNFVYLNGSTTGSFSIETYIKNCFNRSLHGQFIFYIVSGYSYSALAYPNPTTDELTVQFGETTAEEDLPEEIKLYDNKQKIVKAVKVKDNVQENAVKIDVRSLPKGIYYLHVIDSKNPDQDKRIVRQQIKVD